MRPVQVARAAGSPGCARRRSYMGHHDPGETRVAGPAAAHPLGNPADYEVDAARLRRFSPERVEDLEGLVARVWMNSDVDFHFSRYWCPPRLLTELGVEAVQVKTELFFQSSYGPCAGVQRNCDDYRKVGAASVER